SLHPVRTKYVQGTTMMPSKDVEAKEGEETTGKTQGTIWTMYYLPFAVFAMSGVVNSVLAERSGMNEKDLDLLLEGLWQGTIHRQGRGRGIQQPLLLLCVEYKDPYFRIGYLEERLSLFPGREAWLGDNPPTSIEEVKLNITELGEELQRNQEKIDRIRWWKYPEVNLEGNLPGEPSSF
ncbi:MAG: type I CRISPR-associated protein Cas7, partial [bacterium]